MSCLRDLSRDLGAEYRITMRDANEIIRFINTDVIKRVAKGEVVHVDQFGSFHAEDGKIWFNPSDFMVDYIKQYGGPKVKKEKKRGDRWKYLHDDYLKRLQEQTANGED